MSYNTFPWDNDEEKPYWINPENGYLWFVDKSTTNLCTKNKMNWPKLEAICFYVCEKVKDKICPITRVLIDKKTNKVLHEDESLEGMAVKIEVLRMTKKV